MIAKLLTAKHCLVLSALLLCGCPRPEPPVVPEDLKSPRIQTGEGLLQKKVILDDSRLDDIRSITVRSDEPGFIFVGTGGIAWTNPQGEVTKWQEFPVVPFSGMMSNPRLLDVDGDGSLEVFDQGGVGWSEARITDLSGKTKWAFPKKWGMNGATSGHLDADGKLDFVAAYNGGGGVSRFDNTGKLLWNVSDGNVWHIELLDVMGDATPEIIHSNAGGELVVRDATGTVLRKSNPPGYFSSFSVCKWPSPTTDSLVSSDAGHLYLTDRDGTSRTLPAPHVAGHGDPLAARVKLPGRASAVLAVGITYSLWDRSILLIYDDAEVLIYEEILDQPINSLATRRTGAGEDESLLIGSDGKVWEFSVQP